MTIFIAASPARNISFHTFDALDQVSRPCFKVRPLLVLADQPNE